MTFKPGELDISIHAPREGCDEFDMSNFGFDIISIHAPREGCDTGMIKAKQGSR